MVELALTKAEVRVVADQFGTPTYAPDLARAIIAIGRNLLDFPAEPRFRGTFHFAGAGRVVSWSVFAREIFSYLGSRDFRTPKLLRISSAEYPSPVRRPANSYLSCAKLTRVHRIVPSLWSDSLADCLDQLTAGEMLSPL
jgi:dTDP-4-dehydrorhamnose reductase